MCILLEQVRVFVQETQKVCGHGVTSYAYLLVSIGGVRLGGWVGRAWGGMGVPEI